MSLDIVRSVKNSLVDQGVNLVGPDGAFEITKRVAFLTGLGVLSKPTGNNSNGYAVDIVMARDGRIWDVLIDSGGANEPAWNEQPAVDPSRYRESPWHAQDVEQFPPRVTATVDATPDPRIDVLLQKVTDMQNQFNNLIRALTPRIEPTPVAPPAYQGSIFGIKVVLRPV